MHADWQHMPFLAELTEKPWRYSFFQLCRWMDAHSAPHPPLGMATLPRHESLRLGQKPSTAFATREIAEAFHERGRVHVHLLGLGLWGPGGPLPLHLTEEAHERTLVLRDTTLTDFLNIFHHRWLAHFYRAWSMAQAAAGLDRAEEERFSLYISCLAGQHMGGAHSPHGNSPHGENHRNSSHTFGASNSSPHTLGQTAETITNFSTSIRVGTHAGTDSSPAHRDALPTHARLAAVSHLARRSRNPMGLVATLEHYFGVTVQLEEYCFDWLKLEPDAHCRLGRSRQATHVIGDLARRQATAQTTQAAAQTTPATAQTTSWANDNEFSHTPANGYVSRHSDSHAVPLQPVGQSCCLGQDAVLGAYVPDRQCRFALHVGPLSLEDYSNFLPGQPYARALLRWVREFVGLEFAFRLHLLLLPEAVPPCTLGGGARLGRTTWLGRAEGHVDARVDGRAGGRAHDRTVPVVHGAVFSPEGG